MALFDANAFQSASFATHMIAVKTGAMLSGGGHSSLDLTSAAVPDPNMGGVLLGRVVASA